MIRLEKWKERYDLCGLAINQQPSTTTD